MLLLSGAAGMAWVLAVEPVIKAAASAAIMRPVFIGVSYLCFLVVQGVSRSIEVKVRAPSIFTQGDGRGIKKTPSGPRLGRGLQQSRPAYSCNGRPLIWFRRRQES